MDVTEARERVQAISVRLDDLCSGIVKSSSRDARNLSEWDAIAIDIEQLLPYRNELSALMGDETTLWMDPNTFLNRIDGLVFCFEMNRMLTKTIHATFTDEQIDTLKAAGVLPPYARMGKSDAAIEKLPGIDWGTVVKLREIGHAANQFDVDWWRRRNNYMLLSGTEWKGDLRLCAVTWAQCRSAEEEIGT